MKNTMKNNCIYFVEGQCEQKIVEALKEEPQRLRSGKIKLLNPITQEIPSSVLLTIKKGSVVVLVFDTDIPVTEQLKNNIRENEQYAFYNHHFHAYCFLYIKSIFVYFRSCWLFQCSKSPRGCVRGWPSCM